MFSCMISRQSEKKVLDEAELWSALNDTEADEDEVYR